MKYSSNSLHFISLCIRSFHSHFFHFICPYMTVNVFHILSTFYSHAVSFDLFISFYFSFFSTNQFIYFILLFLHFILIQLVIVLDQNFHFVSFHSFWSLLWCSMNFWPNCAALQCSWIWSKRRRYDIPAARSRSACCWRCISFLFSFWTTP